MSVGEQWLGRIPRGVVAAVSHYASLLSLAAWAGGYGPFLLLAAAVFAVVAVLPPRGHRREWRAARAFTFVAILLAFSAEYHLARLEATWPEHSRELESAAQSELSTALVDRLLVEAEAVTERLAEGWAAGTLPDSPALPLGLRTDGIDAVALFGPSGRLRAWDGIHQGPLPDDVRTGAARYIYEEGPLFGYLYVTRVLDDGGVAVAASLLKSELPPGLDAPPDDFESRFAASTGASIDIASSDRMIEGSVFDLAWEDETLLSVALTPPSAVDVRGRVEGRWLRVVAAMIGVAWVLSLIGSAGTPVAGAAVLLPLLVFLPLGRLLSLPEMFSPAGLLLPVPLPLTMGDLLALGAAGIMLVSLLPSRARFTGHALAAAAMGTALALGALALLELGVAGDLLAGQERDWLVFELTAFALVFLAFAAGSRITPRRPGPGRSVLPALGWLTAAGILSMVWVTLVHRADDPPNWLPVLWAVPFWGLLRSLPGEDRWVVGAVRAAAFGVLAASVTLPWAWERRVEARIAQAEERIERLGTRSDPFLEFLLIRAGERAASLAEEGESPVSVLYGAWVDSGLALEGLPLWLTYWSADEVPQEELRIGVSDARPSLPEGMLAEEAPAGTVNVRRFDMAEAHYVGVAPLPGGARLSIVVPPMRLLGGTSPLGPLFSPARSEPDPLVLIPLLPGEVPGETNVIQWMPTAQGWQGETFIAYPDQVYQAHYLLELPTWIVVLARGSLILLLCLLLLGVPWLFGGWVVEGRRGVVRSEIGILASFRGRVTLTLFGFFLIPSLAFGALAYRTLASAAARTAESLAERAAEDAGSWYFEVEGEVNQLATRVGSDLLLYEDGELVGGSLSELVDLGLYHGWVPPEVQQAMVDREVVTTTATTSLGGWDYVVAYRRMPEGRVLAAPAPLQAGATALRQRDVADLIGFSLLLGGVLSVLLALAVGRALVRPIQVLQVASERVGGGNMKVHLPEGRKDEFGSVFDAFNRMVDRLADTRRALLRTSRRTRAIVEEVPTGVVALDPRGRVALASSRVEKLLGVSLERGLPIPRGTDPSDPRSALAEWIEGYFRDELSEAGTELSFGERRVRVRARRISRKGPLGGAVLTLEDVTDELRTERILAWGEMAQQVAHEVKNPLTPIKLGVQHIRRAWDDNQPDYERILDRNVTAILQEIERLAAIASSFSAYGAPSPAGAEPLEGVAVADVAREVLDLYAAGGGPVLFTVSEIGGRVVAQARAAELKEVLINLLENARAALPKGGEVRVEIEPLEGEVELRVVDDGVGIPTELLGRVFEPHFSTRSGGTGLGLAIVRRLVESWGGRVHAESHPGEGTTIYVRLLSWARRDVSNTDDDGGEGDEESTEG